MNFIATYKVPRPNDKGPFRTTDIFISMSKSMKGRPRNRCNVNRERKTIGRIFHLAIYESSHGWLVGRFDPSIITTYGCD